MSPRRFLPGLLLLFVGSGCAALIYEIVWFQLLQLVIGSSSISLGILLGTFMGGMCVGSLLLPRVISPRRHPLRVYALLELGIGAFGLLILVSMPLVGGVYTAWAGEGAAGIVFRAVIAGICLLPPTMLMGATLPAISRWVKTTPEGVAWLGFFYGGNTAGASLARTSPSPRRALGWCQLFICGALAWAAYQLTESLPYWPINPSIATTPWFTMQLDFVRCLWVVLPGAILWGASFPLALAAVATTEQDAARLAGGVYAANTVGAIAGSLVTSFVLIPWIGTSHSEQVIIIVAALSALLMLEPSFSTRAAPSAPSAPSTVPAASAISAFSGTVVLAIAMIAAGMLARSIHPLPGLLVAYGRYSATRVGQADVIYVGEGLNASVAVSELSNGVRNYHNAGKVQASSEPQDMRLQRMLGHLTTLIPEHPRKVLVIGCGAGVTAGAVSVDPAVEHETIAEIEPLVPRVVSTYFSEHNFDVVRNPKVHVRVDDARHFVETTSETFDAVTSDPLDPWVKGAAMLYTAESFDLVKKHLNPGGVVTLFVQLYESNTEAVKSEIGTFLEAFPNGVVFGNTNEGKGYDLVLLGQVEPTRIDVDAVQARLQRPEYAPLQQSLREIGMNSAVDLFATYAGRRPDLEPWLKTAQINHDRNLRLQYLAGLGLNLYQADVIYAEMLRYVTNAPDDLFVASDATKQRLFAAIQSAQGRPQ